MPDNIHSFLSPVENYFIYIVTNDNRTMLETGVTGDLKTRIHRISHGLQDAAVQSDCYYLVYWETRENVLDAISRERELRGFSLKKKRYMIDATNPGWRFLNDELHQMA